MANSKRAFRAKPKSLVGTDYDSLLEKRLHETSLKDSDHHTVTVPYTVEHKYHPDFIVVKGNTTYLIEAKGYFQERSEASKYVWINRALAPNTELVFLFEKHNKPLHFAGVRKDGTRMTHEEWCNRNGFRYFHEDTFSIDKL